MFSLLAKCCLSTPLSNAWPERSASALKRVNPRLRDRPKNEIVQALLHVSINGPPIESDVLQSFAQQWMLGGEQRKETTCHSQNFTVVIDVN